MPSSILYGINNEGRVHTLSTTGSMWREFPYVGQEFKKLSAIPHFLWAIGGDHQVYLCVHGLDVPIRVTEESYENERWIPIEGYTSRRLLPTDRFQFSNADGTVDRAIDKIRLPSMAWQWESEWKLELTLNGQPLDHNGWTYAVDFPAQYHPKISWNSCVRRRLWVRNRRYSAMNSWCAIAPLHKDATAEPFIDIAVGGQSIAGAESGKMVVWAVTSHNRVMFRVGVSTKSPEGSKWNLINIPPGCEVLQLNVGATGLVWASLIDGKALVRTGVTRDNVAGDGWVEVKGPGNGLRINHLSVGTNSVWAISQDKQVWFRKGVKGDAAGTSEESAAGCGWVEMIGRMTLVTVTSNDQVFAIGADDRAVYFRTGVTQADLTGKRWKSLHAPFQTSRTSSTASLNSGHRSSDANQHHHHQRHHHRSVNSLNNHRPHSLCETSRLCDYEEQSHSAPTAPTSLPVDSGKHYETQLKNPKAWSPVRSVGSIVGTEVLSDETVYQSERQDSCVYDDDELELGWAEYEAAPWSWVEAGACTIDATQLPNWFADGGGAHYDTELDRSWRLQILTDLKSRLDARHYDNYPNAIDTASWTYKTEAKISMRDANYIDCLLQIEWLHTTGSLTVLNADGATTMHQFSASEIVCVQCCSEPGYSRLIVHTPQLTPSAIRLQFASDSLMEEWQTHFANVCNQVHEITGRPSVNTVWAVTNLGDVFVWDAKSVLDAQRSSRDVYVHQYDIAGKRSPIELPLYTSCSPGLTVTVDGCVEENADRIGFDLAADGTYKTKNKTQIALGNTPFHFNPRFVEARVVRNTMVEDTWGDEERDGTMPFEAGKEFTLTIAVGEDDYRVHVNGKEFCRYRHRLPYAGVNAFRFWGNVNVSRVVVESPRPIVRVKGLHWRQLGGHLRCIETCALGVTWAIGCDHTAWVYNGGWGGGFYGTLDSKDANAMTDAQDYRVYENQRWNPVSGYTSAGLPTDRYMWSDASGKQKRMREQVKLLSSHWQWISDWMIDFHVPGGCDADGWQYAVDFPSTFHARKNFTDYVRRRRWYRRCAVSTTGPWTELGRTKLIDVALQPVGENGDDSVCVWALSNDGQVMIRLDVRKSNPMGTKWEHVPADQPMISISSGPYDRVWSIGKNGCAYARLDITGQRLNGTKWVCIEPPRGVQLKEISVGRCGIWAIDNNGDLHARKDVSDGKPEGSSWQRIGIDPALANSEPKATAYKHVSVGNDNEVWATTNNGLILRRIGISRSFPLGSCWDVSISGNWQHISAKAF